MTRSRVIPAILAMLFLPACSIKRIAANQLGSALAGLILTAINGFTLYAHAFVAGADHRIRFAGTAASLMEIYAAIVIQASLLVIIGHSFGGDPVHLGIIFLVNLELGYLTPPVGPNLLVSSYRFKTFHSGSLAGRDAAHSRDGDRRPAHYLHSRAHDSSASMVWAVSPLRRKL